ncbi:MAG: non-canonical purine NTP pyrophosphatase [Planctomycetota bacterium]
MITEVFYASANPGKAAEAAAILAAAGIRMRTIKDFPGYPSPDEDGADFVANAVIKARAGFRHAGIPSLGEDAGLEVTALNNEPGLYSARYLGAVPQAARNADIIRRLDAVPGTDRGARFHSAVALAGLPGLEAPLVAEGFCYGVIGAAPRGGHGFGYDPIFILPELGLTFGELDAARKNRISHRHNALAALTARLNGMQAVR